MRKAINSRYGGLDVVKIVEDQIPDLKTNEVLVNVKAAGLNPKDILIRKGKFKSLSGKKFPQSIGFDFSGIIENSNNSDFQKGEKVFGMINGWKGRCCADYLNVNKMELFKMPSNLTFEEAAGIPLASQTALQAIREIGQLKKGESICINGASGGVGTMAIQIAKELGGNITTISSSKNVSFCKSLGGHNSISYEEIDILASKERFDVFFDAFGNYSFKKTKHLLTTRGKYITTVPKAEIIKEQLWNLLRRKKAKMVIVKSRSEDLKWLAEKISNNNLKPILYKVYPFDKIREAQKDIESKRAKGKVVITMHTL